MITRRGILTALFGGLAAPAAVASPPDLNDRTNKATASVSFTWDPRRGWVRGSTMVMAVEGDEAVSTTFDSTGKKKSTYRCRIPKYVRTGRLW